MIKKRSRFSFTQVILALSCALFVYLSVPQTLAPVHAQPAVQDPAPAVDDAGVIDEERTCEDVAGFEMGWAVCPILRTISSILDSMVEFIVDQMDFDGHHRSTEVQNTWEGLRNVARIFYSLALVFVIYAVATGTLINSFDARKMAQGLFVAILMVELSFSGLAFLIDVTNDIGQGIGDFILTAGGVDNAENLGLPVDTGSQILDAVLGIGDVVVGVVAVIIGLGAFIFMLSGLAILWLVIILRNFVVLTLFVLAPLALVMYALPFGSGFTKKWWTFFSTGLFLYPLLTASLAMGALAAKVTVAAQGEGLGRLVAVVTANVLTFGTPLAVGYIIQTVGGTFGRFAGVFDKNGKRFNLLSRLRGSDSVQEPLARARAGKFGNDGSRKARIARVATNPLGYLADDASFKGSEFLNNRGIVRRAGGRASAKSNAAHTELVGKYLKEIDTRGVVGDSYRDSQLAQSLFAMERFGEDHDRENAGIILEHLKSSNNVLYGNVMRNMSYIKSHPEGALAQFQGLANMGKISQIGETFAVAGLKENPRALAALRNKLVTGPGMHMPITEEGKFVIGDGFDGANTALQFMEDVAGYDAGTMGVAIQGLGNASYGKGQQLDKYLNIYNKDGTRKRSETVFRKDNKGNFIRDENGNKIGRARIDRNSKKALEKAGPRFWLGGNESVKQGGKILTEMAATDYGKLQDIRKDIRNNPGTTQYSAADLDNQTNALLNTLELVAAAEGMEQHVELKNKQTIQRTVSAVLAQEADQFEVSYTDPKTGTNKISELEYFLNVARQKQRTVTQSDAFVFAKKHGSSYGGGAVHPDDLPRGGPDQPDPLSPV